MALRRGLSGAALQRNRPSRSRLPLAVVISLSLLAPLIFFVGRGIYTIDHTDVTSSSSKQDVDWRERLALQHIKSLLSKEVIDVITATTDDLGPFSLDYFRKSNLSASWKVVGLGTSVENNASSLEPNQMGPAVKQERPGGKQDKYSGGDHSQFIDSPAKLVRRVIIMLGYDVCFNYDVDYLGSKKFLMVWRHSICL